MLPHVKHLTGNREEFAPSLSQFRTSGNSLEECCGESFFQALDVLG
jgi:hypothetical protein